MINQGDNLFSIELVIILDPEGPNKEKYISMNGPSNRKVFSTSISSVYFHLKLKLLIASC